MLRSVEVGCFSAARAPLFFRGASPLLSFLGGMLPQWSRVFEPLRRPSWSFMASALAIPWLASLACTNIEADPAGPRTGGPSRDRGPAVVENAHKTVDFREDGITFSSDFESGRLSDVTRLGSRRYQVLISPENSPINDSAWYYFAISSSSEAEIEVLLAYEEGTHRYDPKISRDGNNWTQIEADRYATNEEEIRRLCVWLWGPEATRIAAQAPLTASDLEAWALKLSSLPFVEISQVGRSPLGAELSKLDIGSTGDNAEVVVILGRLHPPEVTGSIALQAFVETICGDSNLAVQFRARHQVVVFPLVNPDGVRLGHWRHNSRGVDLNRDWAEFRQVETRLVRDALVALGEQNVVLADRLSFNYEDIFYLLQHADTRFEEAWIEEIAGNLPSYRFRIQRVASGYPVAMNWLAEHLDTPAVTYEVGDSTGVEATVAVGREAARAAMRLLISSARSTFPATGTSARASVAQRTDSVRRARPSLLIGSRGQGRGRVRARGIEQGIEGAAATGGRMAGGSMRGLRPPANLR